MALARKQRLPRPQRARKPTKEPRGPRAVLDRRSLLVSVISIHVGLLVWHLLTGPPGVIRPQILPLPGTALERVLRGLREAYAGGALVQHTVAGLRVVIFGFAAATLVSVPLGVFTRSVRAADQLVSPLLNTLRPIPPLAWVPLALLWFGIGDAS